MPLKALRSYARKLPALLAEYRMILSEAASYPHMTEEGRDATRRTWEQLLDTKEAEPISSPTAHKARLAMMGIGVEIV